MEITEPDKNALTEFLGRFPESERQARLDEAVRLSNIVIKYRAVERKRHFNKSSGKYDFTKEVYNLCRESACINYIIVAREPSRARPPSPYTLDRWSRNFKVLGLRAFLRAPTHSDPLDDNRRARISTEAVEWINKNWRKYKGATALYNSLRESAEKKGWKIPSRSWLYRRWKAMPRIVSVSHLENKDAYQSRLAPYVPRDLSDLDALQVLCGDHRETDVTVHVGGGKLARLWLTYWLDLRTYLIWGWYLSLTPTSEAISLAYANGIFKFGAQPFSRPEDDFYSYIYTDRGKTYRSHDVEGKVIKIHERAADIDGKFSYFLADRNVGLVEEFRVRHLLARVRNPKEKQIERVNKDFSEWEKNEFGDCYCGSKPSERPDGWLRLFEKHNKLLKTKNFKSPFIDFEEYKAKLSERIEKHNSCFHERSNLDGKSIIPIEEYNRLYRTRYEIPPDLVASLLMKSAARTVGKIGITCFRKHWHYWHDDMSELKGLKVEVHFTDSDYAKVWVVLPNKKMCEARRVEPVSMLNPNKEVIRQIKKIEANENRIIRDFQLIQQSKVRGETAEDRLIEYILSADSGDHISSLKAESAGHITSASIHLFPRIVRSENVEAGLTKTISVAEVSKIKAKNEIFATRKIIKINEFD